MATAQVSTNERNQSLTVWQWVTLVMLTIGYGGYYVCRVHLSICTPSLIKETDLHLTKPLIGHITAVGLLFYAAGKFCLGSTTDIIGGKRMFLMGMGGAILCSVAFGMSSTLPLFTVAWCLNRAVQSGGWASLVKISSRWFSYSSYGTIMGAVSLSFLFGDFLSRLFLGAALKQMQDAGVAHAWRNIFYLAGALLLVILVANILLLKESPSSVGQPEPHTNPANVYGADGDDATPAGIFEILLPLLKNTSFWLVCLLSFGFTMVRETFNDWIPTYLTEVTHMSEGSAAMWSSLFPLFGALSVLICGYLSDRMGPEGRARIILGGLVLATPALLMLSLIRVSDSAVMALAVFGAVAFLMLGPYSFLAGAIGMDFGGKKGSSSASGWIDGTGYIGGMLAGSVIGHIAEKSGWSTAFGMLATVAAFTTVAAWCYLLKQRQLIRMLDKPTHGV